MSKAICTGLTSSGNSSSDANSSTFNPVPTVIFDIASSPPRKMCAPFGPLPGSLVPALMNAGVLRIVDRDLGGIGLEAARRAEDPLVAIAVMVSSTSTSRSSTS